MKTLILSLTIISILFITGCEPDQPSAPQLSPLLNDISIAAVGNSLTAGFQSSGLMEDFQLNSFPYLISQQMNNTEFEQPIISAPGIGSPSGLTPQYLDNDGNIVQDSLTVNPLFLLQNALLERPYDNLGVPGADLNDLLNTIDGTGGNPFFDMILRNPNLLNTTQIEQAALLQPSILLLWAGNNDVLGAALAGGDANQITPDNEFAQMMGDIIEQLQTDLPRTQIIMANIPNVTDIPYINTLDRVFVGGVPMLFDDTLTPIDFGGGLNLPVITAETNVEHITLMGLAYYQNGIGIPDSAYMVDNLGLTAQQASQAQAGLILGGLTPSGLPMDGTMTITTGEAATIANAVSGFNTTIETLTQANNIPLVDANALLNELNTSGLDGATGYFVLLDPATTAFSLDGVHPNNAGHAIMANAFIDAINNSLNLSPQIPKVNVADKLGQYVPPTKIRVNKAISNVREIFRR